jgi:hypothetical protein
VQEGVPVDARETLGLDEQQKRHAIDGVNADAYAQRWQA